jgi:hypothetical protein
MIGRKRTQSPPASAPHYPSPEQVLEALKARTAELRKLDKQLNAEQIALENSGAKSHSDGRSIALDQRALALLRGEGIEGIPLEPAGSRLTKIIEEREVIRRALELADSQAMQAGITRAVERSKARFADAVEIQRQRALAVARLDRLARQWQALEADVRGPHGAGTNGLPLLGFAGTTFGMVQTGSALRTFLEQALRAGIVTQKELDNA